jgi:hypothetical protein
MELRIEGALRPGDFIGYRDDGDFVEDLDGIKDEIVKLTKIGKAQRAVGLFEAFIAGCYLKAEEIDDSGGSFGAFVGELFCAWVQARQRAKADPHETATRLLVWMEKDDYGFCHRLEDDAVKVLSKAGLAAFERAVREQFDRGVPGGGDARAERRASFWRRHLRDVLKTITAARDDVPAYLAVCGDDVSPKDCEVVAQMHATGKRLAEALSWVERGLKLKDDKRWGSHDSYRLDEMKRDILKKLGRHEDALEAAWQEFTEAPSEYSYDDLMKYVPKTKRGEWHDKAMAAAEKGDLDGYLGICKRTKEWGPLAARIQRVPRAQIEAIGHYTAEPAAKGLAKAHPAAAAKVYVALGFRIVNAKKSKYYDAAIANFRAAKQCYEKAGLGGDWKKIAKTVRADHRRKSGFIKDFERIVSGEVDRPEPSFLDRARERWGQRPS